jgi:hypothetical protein
VLIRSSTAHEKTVAHSIFLFLVSSVGRRDFRSLLMIPPCGMALPARARGIVVRSRD